MRYRHLASIGCSGGGRVSAKACADQGIDAYIATGRLPQGQLPPPKRGPRPKDAEAKARIARKLRSKKGSRIDAQRKAIMESVNGQIKEARCLRRFLQRGLEKADTRSQRHSSRSKPAVLPMSSRVTLPVLLSAMGFRSGFPE